MLTLYIITTCLHIVVVEIVSTQKSTDIFEGKMPNLVGKFSIASRAPNADMKAPLESSGFVDVDRLFKHAKQTFYDREIRF
jgi:hypothetical protein